MPRKLTQEDFILRATKVHGNKYDYSKTVYTGAMNMVEIICPIHGIFNQLAMSHMKGCGCVKCACDIQHNQQRKSAERFVTEVKEIHGNKYDLSLAEYINNKTPIKVICHEHGIWMARPYDLLKGHGCPRCADINNGLRKMGSKDGFIKKANEIHKDKYDYSKVVYNGASRHVEIICPKHGSFMQTPSTHLRGRGCPICKSENAKRKICGIGINDLLGTQNENAYKVWSNMIRRCYSIKWRHKYPSYEHCSVCEEWHTYSNFKAWYNARYKDGYELDKDILYHGNKVYSPNNCLIVPSEINSIFISKRASRGKYPIGVCEQNGKFIAALSKHYKNSRVTIGRFDTQEEAFEAYKQAKETYIKDVAEEFYQNGKIDNKTYLALMKYEVLITD